MNTKLTYDQWATVHLLFTSYLQHYCNFNIMGWDMPRVTRYANNAFDALICFVDQRPEREEAINILAANHSLTQIFPEDAKNCSEEDLATMEIFARVLMLIVKKSDVVLGSKSFLERFKDITVTEDEEVRSSTALKILNELLEKEQNCTLTFPENGTQKSSEKDSVATSKEMDRSQKNKSNLKDTLDQKNSEAIDSPLFQYKSQWDRVRPLLNELTLEGRLLFHGISLNIANGILDDKDVSKYDKAITHALFTSYQFVTPKQKLKAACAADEVYVKIKDSNLLRIEKDLKSEEDIYADKQLFTIATDLLLRFVRYSLSKNGILRLLDGVRADSSETYCNEEIRNLAFTFYERANEEYDRIFGIEPQEDQDWIEYWEAPDDENEEGPSVTYPTEELSEASVSDHEIDQLKAENETLRSQRKRMALEIIAAYSKKISAFDLEYSLVFHLLSQNIMSRTLRARIYSKYKRAVKKFVSAYLSGSIQDKTLEHKTLELRKRAEELFLDIRGNMCMLDESVIKNDGRNNFKLAMISNDNCLNLMSNLSKGFVKEFISDLTLNEITRDYVGYQLDRTTTKILFDTQLQIMDRKKNHEIFGL